MTPATEQTLAKLAVAFAGLAWGLYWMPLRGLAAAGMTGVWAVMLFQTVPLLLALPLALWRRTSLRANWRVLALLGGSAAASMALYAAALLYTDILRAIVLFYLMPVWSTLLERAVAGVRITAARSIAMGFAAAAVVLMFGASTGLPVPRAAGDWMALGAGLLWSLATVLMHQAPRQSALDLSVAYFLAGAAATALFLPLAAPPPLMTVAAQLWWLVPATAIIVAASVMTSMWGAPRISPGLSGLLYMTEIAAGAITSALFAGEPFGWRQATGVSLIALAGACESLVDLWQQCRR